MSQATAVTAEIALSAATVKTVLEITAPSTKPIAISEWWVEFDGVTGSNAAVVVSVRRKTATITGTSLTPRSKRHDADVLSTAKHTATVEGTDGDILYTHEIHPQGGKHVLFPLGDEITVPKSGIIAITCTAPDAVNCVAGFGWRE